MLFPALPVLKKNVIFSDSSPRVQAIYTVCRLQERHQSERNAKNRKRYLVLYFCQALQCAHIIQSGEKKHAYNCCCRPSTGFVRKRHERIVMWENAKKLFKKQKSGYRLDETLEYSNECERIVLECDFSLFLF